MNQHAQDGAGGVSIHATLRAAERANMLARAGMNPAEVERALAKAETIARKYAREDLAVCLARLRGQVGETWGQGSNGNEVWAICRRGEVVTVMFRRSTQPKLPGAFGVRRVLA